MMSFLTKKRSVSIAQMIGLFLFTYWVVNHIRSI